MIETLHTAFIDFVRKHAQSTDYLNRIISEPECPILDIQDDIARIQTFLNDSQKIIPSESVIVLCILPLLLKHRFSLHIDDNTHSIVITIDCACSSKMMLTFDTNNNIVFSLDAMNGDAISGTFKFIDINDLTDFSKVMSMCKN